MSMNLLIPKNEIHKLRIKSYNYLSHTLTDRQLCDIELLLNGAFNPLKGFLNKSDYESVLDNLELSNGSIWPVPVNLDVNDKLAHSISIGDCLSLKDKEGFLIAILKVESKWKPDKFEEAEIVFGTQDKKHPGVNFLLNHTENYYLGGTLKGIQLPKHYDFQELRKTPDELKIEFSQKGWETIVAFQTRNPMHRAHVEITKLAAKEIGGNLLIHPTVGMTKPGDIDHFTRVRCYKKLISKYPNDTTTLSLLPLAMRMAGPREALWHAIIRKNYGCTHFIVGRDHAGPGNDSRGKPFYGPYDAQKLLISYADQIGIKMVPFRMMVYIQEKKKYLPIDKVPVGMKSLNISGSELRKRLENGIDLPDWFSYPDIVKELRMSYPEKKERGLTIFFTGLSGSGKSTLANGLKIKLLQVGNRSVTLLDGDIVRTHLSSELGFSKEHRSINVQRIGYVASEITKNRGIAICAPIAPYSFDREFNRNLITNYGGYIEIHVSTPLEICEKRDAKGLYKLARKGVIKEFTGISDPYETPKNPDLIIDSSKDDPEILVERILSKIKDLGYL